MSDELTKAELAQSLEEAWEQWSPFMHLWCVGSKCHTKPGWRCKQCGNSNTVREEITHQDDCPYKQAELRVEKAREEGLI